MADEQRVVDVTLHNVGLRLVGGVSPIGDLANSAEEEDTLALAAPDLYRPMLTGFMIHTNFCSLQRLNSSRKMGYSLGRL